jgi:hypothetical protein
MCAKTIRVNDVGPEPSSESTDLPPSADRWQNRARGADYEAC